MMPMTSTETLKTCLIVDDDVFDRTHIKRVMERQTPELEFFEMETLTEARNFLKARQADIILLDNLLPDGSGAEFARELREDKTLRDTPIFVVSNAAVKLTEGDVKAVLKDELSARSMGEMLTDFMNRRHIEQATDTARLLEEFGVTVGENLTPVFSRMIRNLRSARSNIVLNRPELAIENLEHIEEMMLAISQVVIGQDRQPRN